MNSNCQFIVISNFSLDSYVYIVVDPKKKRFPQIYIGELVSQRIVIVHYVV